MKWEDRGRSRNLEDRRGRRSPAAAGLPIGIGGLVLIVAFSLLTGTDPLGLLSLLGLAPQSGTSAAPSQQSLDAEEEQVRFVSFVLDDTQDVWTGIFAASRESWRDARLVLFRDAVDTSCGFAPAAIGPFYCPADEKVYIDLSFYDELHTRFGAPGDFAEAYVIAHEIGHHVQNLLGIMNEVQQAQQAQPAVANSLSVALELQADCFAGIWASSANARGVMERGDLEEGLGAAAAVGDDRLQRQQAGRVNPDTFTHGTSAQRMQWFSTGFDTGSPEACDTFTSL